MSKGPSPAPPPPPTPSLVTVPLAAELAILSVALGMVLRIALKPPFRRDLRELPRRWVVLGVVLAVAGLTLGAWIVIRWGSVRHFAVVVALAGMIGAWVRARPQYGMRRGFPPGSLGVGRSVDAIYDRGFYLDQVRSHGPVYKMSQFGRPVVCVYGLRRARTLLATESDALVGASLPYNRALGKGSLRYMANDTHQQERPLFRQAFSAFDLAGSEAFIRRSCRRQLEALVRTSVTLAGGANARPYFARFLLEALSNVFFGLDQDDPRVNRFEALLPVIEIGRMGGSAWRARFDAALVEATLIMEGIARDGAGDTPALSKGTALGTLLALDPQALEDQTRARNLFVAFKLANGDVVGLLDWIFTKLSTHVAWQDNVRREPRANGEPASSQPRDVGARVVLETLRLEQSEFLYRRVLRPLTIDGYTIPAGWLLRVLVQESHRDPEVFAAPDTFDPDRFLQRSFDKSEYAPFGADVHGCMGARLTLFLGRVLAEELCHGFEWTITQDGPLERGTRHRHHWRPSSLRRVVMRERTATPNAAVTDGAKAATCPMTGHP